MKPPLDIKFEIRSLIKSGTIFEICHRWLSVIRQVFRGYTKALRDRSTGTLEFELREMENIFGLLVMGPLVGIRAPVFGVSVRIAPFMANEFNIMMSRSRGAEDPLGDLFSVLDIG